MSASSIAAKLKLKRKAPEDAAPPAKRPGTAVPPSFSAGDTVMGNFKGFGDWDEALVMGVNADGTYTLEYVDEGLIEESVPLSRIAPMGGVDADAAAEAASGQPKGPPAVDAFKAGDTVMGNFKGFGDWDEALVMGVNADGTYTLEYVDEGLIEESVPLSRIAPMGGADAAAAAEAASGEPSATYSSLARLPLQAELQTEPQAELQTEPQAAEESGEDESSGEESDDAGGGVMTGPFVASSKWCGPRPGYAFKAGVDGLGYYKDVPLHVAAEEAEKAAMVLTAPQLANWSIDALSAPPSAQKADQYFGLFHLEALRVHTLAAPGKGAHPTLFASLQEWFDAQLPALAGRLPSSAVEVTLRMFLAPQQSVRQGLQHVTFAVDWMCVGADAADEPLSSALLKRMGMSGRRPSKMRLVVMYRVEHNRITTVWADIDREGLGSKRGATLDDVLLSDAFDQCLTLARKGGAQGRLDPLFHNYHEVEVLTL